MLNASKSRATVTKEPSRFAQRICSRNEFKKCHRGALPNRFPNRVTLNRLLLSFKTHQPTLQLYPTPNNPN